MIVPHPAWMRLSCVYQSKSRTQRRAYYEGSWSRNRELWILTRSASASIVRSYSFSKLLDEWISCSVSTVGSEYFYRRWRGSVSRSRETE